MIVSFCRPPAGFHRKAWNDLPVILHSLDPGGNFTMRMYGFVPKHVSHSMGKSSPAARPSSAEAVVCVTSAIVAIQASQMEYEPLKIHQQFYDSPTTFSEKQQGRKCYPQAGGANRHRYLSTGGACKRDVRVNDSLSFKYTTRDY